jgi:hypothetical protein
MPIPKQRKIEIIILMRLPLKHYVYDVYQIHSIYEPIFHDFNIILLYLISTNGNRIGF